MGTTALNPNSIKFENGNREITAFLEIIEATASKIRLWTNSFFLISECNLIIAELRACMEKNEDWLMEPSVRNSLSEIIRGMNTLLEDKQKHKIIPRLIKKEIRIKKEGFEEILETLNLSDDSELNGLVSDLDNKLNSVHGL